MTIRIIIIIIIIIRLTISIDWINSCYVISMAKFAKLKCALVTFGQEMPTLTKYVDWLRGTGGQVVDGSGAAAAGV